VDLSNPEAYAWMKQVLRCEFASQSATKTGALSLSPPPD
jgi:hypothetical protein